MLLALLAVITLYTILLYACKRDTGELLRMLFTLSLGIFWFGILTYISKKGGYGKEFIPILYGGAAIYRKLQYLRLTLGQLGYTVAVGRYLFPFLFMLVALHASNFIPTEHLKWYYLAASILPLVSLVLYIPSVFEALIEPSEARLRLSVTLSYSWIIAYLLIGWACLLKETFSITVRFFRSRFLQNLAFYASTTLLYAIYCKQDPAQIYLFYRNDYMWMLGLWYLNKGFRPMLYSLVWVVTVLSCIISLLSLVSTAHITWNEQHEQALLERKGNEMQPGINIFTHGLKNQLLANQIVIGKIAEQNVPSQKALVSSLQANNQLMLNASRNSTPSAAKAPSIWYPCRSSRSSGWRGKNSWQSIPKDWSRCGLPAEPGRFWPTRNTFPKPSPTSWKTGGRRPCRQDGPPR